MMNFKAELHNSKPPKRHELELSTSLDEGIDLVSEILRQQGFSFISTIYLTHPTQPSPVRGNEASLRVSMSRIPCRVKLKRVQPNRLRVVMTREASPLGYSQAVVGTNAFDEVDSVLRDAANMIKELTFPKSGG